MITNINELYGIISGAVTNLQHSFEYIKSALSGYYNKEQIDIKLDNYYNKTEVDQKIDQKANNYYTKPQVDGIINEVINTNLQDLHDKVDQLSSIVSE